MFPGTHTQYKTLLPKITMLCNHQGPLLDLHSGKPFPMVPVGDFNLKDKIFPGMPGDSLLFNGDELAKLQRKRYQIPTYREEKPPDSSSQQEKPSSSCGLEDTSSSTSKEGESSKSSGKSPWALSPKVSTDSPSRKPSCHGKCSPPSKEQRDKREKDSHSSSLKHKDKPDSDRSGKDKEGDKSLWKCPMSPSQWLPSTERVRKEPHLEETSLTVSVNSEGHHQSPSKYLSEMDDQASFVGPTSTSTPNKTGGGPCHCSSSNDSRCSITPFKMGMSGSFSYPSSTGVRCGSITPATSIARSQQVTSSGWQPTGSFSPLPSQAMDTLSTEQAAEIYQLAAECQALGSELAKQFQNLSRLEAVHHTAAHQHGMHGSQHHLWCCYSHPNR